MYMFDFSKAFDSPVVKAGREIIYRGRKANLAIST